MQETTIINKIYNKLKNIEKNMITRKDMDKLVDTLEIMQNPDTMEQLKASNEDKKQGRIKVITSMKDLLRDINA
ncbi:hypothetical protein J4232_06265 [Candidatus Woesearchaeota archaeon]|nr:hypothetical protein [Candidatus Woesearchaeota archaeon]